MLGIKNVTFILLYCCCALLAVPDVTAKEHYLTDILLAELLNRMDQRDPEVGQNYYDLIESDLPRNLDLLTRSSKNSAGAEDYEFRNMFGGGASNPALRDQEFLQHSSLWGHQYVSGGMGEGPNRLSTIIKTDAGLPSYCNPPNPCPYGYDEDQGCILDFENTAIFSREYQAAQDCTCDGEHMFDCTGQEANNGNGNGNGNSNGGGGGGADGGSISSNDMSPTVEKLMMDKFQSENSIENINSIIKKTYPLYKHPKLAVNPYFEGEKLPIAAKKGNRIY